jgi:hypothetical protein
MSADPRDEAGLLSAPIWVFMLLGAVFAGIALWALIVVASAAYHLP